MVLELDHMYSSAERQVQIQLQEQFRGSAQPRASNVVSQQTPSKKLSKIELPKFNGEPNAWIAFWDLFRVVYASAGCITSCLAFDIREYVTAMSFLSLGVPVRSRPFD